MKVVDQPQINQSIILSESPDDSRSDMSDDDEGKSDSEKGESPKIA
jgi:hypothetical protein